MTQTDISHLQGEEVNWEVGRIIRRRTKTDRFTDVPEVNYKLWPSTWRLLKRFGNVKGTCLRTEKGNPLVCKSLVDGKKKKSDNIKSAYSRACKAANLAPKALKYLRKTSANILDQNGYAHLSRYFLAHTGSNIAEKHYLDYAQSQFDEALDFAGQLLEIEMHLYAHQPSKAKDNISAGRGEDDVPSQ
jgi:hypothetical protein